MKRSGRAPGATSWCPPNPTLTQIDGAIIAAPTLDLLAEAIGVKPAALAETVAAYNAAITAGRAAHLAPPRSPGRRFGVKRQSPDRVPPRAVTGPGFFAAPLCVGITCTMGGIAIDTKTRVLREDGAPIEGLFAAGSTTGGIEGGKMAGYIGGIGKAYCTGFIAGGEIGGAQ